MGKRKGVNTGEWKKYRIDVGDANA